MSGNMDDLKKLREFVRVGTRINIRYLDYISGGTERVVTACRDNIQGAYRGIETEGFPRTKGGKGRGYFLWPEEGDDFEVDVDSMTLRLYSPNHAYTGGRALTLVMKFTEGGE